jgi:hypothetical protein
MWVCAMTPVRMLAMRGKARGLWPVVAVAAIAAGTFGLLYVVYQSPHRSDLEAFLAVAVPVAAAAAGLITRAWRLRAGQHGDAVGVPELDHLADLLAGAVKDQWTRAAGDRGLLEPEPIPVRWRRSVLPVAGPVSAAVGSTRFPPLPGLRSRAATAADGSDTRPARGVRGPGVRSAGDSRYPRVGQERASRLARLGRPQA